MCRIRRHNALLCAIEKRKLIDLHKGRRAAEYGTDGDPLRRAEGGDLGGSEFCRIVGHRRNTLLLRREEGLFRHGRCRCSAEIVRKCTSDGSQFIRPAERLDRPAVGLHTKILRRIAEFGYCTFNRCKLF